MENAQIFAQLSVRPSQAANAPASATISTSAYSDREDN
jgi:hypothetical protein